MKMKLQKIDRPLSGDHRFLKDDDRCFFFCEYYSGQGYKAGDCNDLISNFKKSVSRRKELEYEHKRRAIQQIAKMVGQSLPEEVINKCTFVPIPPSKAEADALYDDRCSQVLKIVHKQKGIDFRELLLLSSSHEACHTNT